MTDTTDLKARLRACRVEYSEGNPGGLIEPINPDGPEAADALDAKDRTIERLEAEVERLEGLVHVPGVWRCACHKWCHERAAEALKGQTP